MAEALPSAVVINNSLSRDIGLHTGLPAQSPTAVEINGNKDGRLKSNLHPETKQDHWPPSKQIFDRTHPDKGFPQTMPVGVSPEGIPKSPEDMALPSMARAPSDQFMVRANTSESLNKDKKKGVSFLSRFIGTKKKETIASPQDDDYEEEGKRAEGTDADVFSQPIEFIPKIPAPPKYIKVRSRGKREKDFNRVFLAQELRGRTGVEIAQAGGRLVKAAPINPPERTKDENSIWAMEFSKDGRFLAAGGNDRVVRVWAVISTEEDRRVHEREEDAVTRDGQRTRLSAPVFKTKPIQEYEGHTASILDLSWSKNNFLLSSSTDKTVRLWHTSRSECLCCFKHSDFVTSIQFHPRDDRFFLAGSLDSKLRLWSIPDKAVAYWAQLSDLVTAVAFSPDGKTSIAGCLSGLCMFYDTEGLKYLTQMTVRSAHGKNAKGSKVTGIQTINYPPNDPHGEVKLLITSNDSRVRVYNLRDKCLELKLKGLENTYSQIHATFSDDAKYIICGSEDRKSYIWSTISPEKDKENRPVEMFEAHSAIVTSAIMAPVRTRQLLQMSGDPLYDLCNPPPVTLVSRTESHSSNPPNENDLPADPSIPPTPMTTDSTTKTLRPEESPAYVARSCHVNGNIIITADYTGRIKVFRQDCSYKKRLRAAETWDAPSTLSKKMLNRSPSTATRTSRSSHPDSLSHPPSDRILSWRQSIEHSNGASELSSSRISTTRSVSPRKSHPANSRYRNHNLSAVNAATPSFHTGSTPPSISKSSMDSTSLRHHSQVGASSNPSASVDSGPDHNWLLNQTADPSLQFWNKAKYVEQARHSQVVQPQPGDGDRDAGGSGVGSADVEKARIGGATDRRTSVGSSEEEGEEEAEEVRCRECRGKSFRARAKGRGGGRELVCEGCGVVA